MKNLWIYLSILSCVITAITVILMKYISYTRCNIKTLIIISFLIGAFFTLLYIPFDKDFKNDIIKNITKKDILLCNRFSQAYTYKISPNIGYSHLIINANVIITLIASYFLFNNKINCQSFFGIILTLLGLTITIYYSNKK
jgi:drug/metabolite transporter (DMT)-like permease